LQISQLEKELVRERVAAKQLRLENDKNDKLRAQLEAEIANLKNGTCGPCSPRMSFRTFISTPKLAGKVKQWTGFNSVEELQDFWGILNCKDDLGRIPVRKNLDAAIQTFV